MFFAPGDRVHLAGIGTGHVIESRGSNRYAVDIKGRIVVAASRDLELVNDRSKSRHVQQATDVNERLEPSTQRRSAPSIDLHGKTVHEAIELVEAFINDALLDGRSDVEIIHGRSGGRVKAAVHAYLRRLSTVAAFRVDAKNPGVTIVVFA